METIESTSTSQGEWAGCPPEGEVITYSHGITRYCMEDGQVLVVASEGDMSREAIDAWASVVRETLLGYPADRHLFVVLDLSGPRQGLTPHSSYRARELYQMVVSERIVGTSVAVILRDSIIAQIISVFARQLASGRRDFHQRIFTNMDAALEWLHRERDTLHAKSAPASPADPT